MARTAAILFGEAIPNSTLHPHPHRENPAHATAIAATSGRVYAEASIELG
jgi:hypothetical protein